MIWHSTASATTSPVICPYATYLQTAANHQMCAGTSYTSAEQRSSGEPSTSAPTQPAARPSKSLRKEADVEKAKICDRLIALFQEKPVKEWRQLMAFSKQWPMLRKRCA